MPVNKSINKDFFKKWSPEMSYVLGFFAADGNLVVNSRGSYFLAFYSADREILVSIKRAMNSSHKISKRSKRSGGVYRIQIGSKEMANDLIKLEFNPRKTTRIKVPTIPHNYIGDFIRGYFDGDGNIWMGSINKNRTKPTAVIQASFTSGCKDFLINLLNILHSMEVKGGSLSKVKDMNCWRLSLSTLDALKLYEIMYNVPDRLYLKRKKSVFDRFMKMRV